MCKARESEIANENANNVQISIVENWFGKSSAMQIDFSIVYWDIERMRSGRQTGGGGQETQRVSKSMENICNCTWNSLFRRSCIASVAFMSLAISFHVSQYTGTVNVGELFLL